MQQQERTDNLRLLARAPEMHLPGWRLVRDDGDRGLLFQHTSGRHAGVAQIAPLKKARVADVTGALKDVLGGRGVIVDWAVLYCEHGYLETAEKVLARRKTGIVLLFTDTSSARHTVKTFQAARLDGGDGPAFTAGCMSAIQQAVSGVPRAADDEHLGFSNFSVDRSKVEAITFMSEREYGLRRLDLVRSARRSIVLSTFNFRDAELENQLIARAREKLRVVCIVGDSKRIQGHNRNSVERLTAGGVVVVPAANHAKCLVVDRRYVILGSANASDPKHQLLEFNLELNAPPFADELLSLLARRVPDFGKVEVPGRG